ncbi:MAG: cation:proton antiporter, partial [Burkholderiales bacterium]
MHLLDSVLLLLATAVVVVVVFRALRLPALIGYLIVGMIIGPHALAWLPDTAATKNLAEFGVVFLMFSIGLEFSLPKLSTMKSTVFGLGAAQVIVTILAVLGVATYFGLDWRGGLALGGVLAMSSTAILAKMLAERLELNTRHGRQIIGVLLFQDLAVVPLLVILPALTRGTEELPKHLLLAGLNATLLLIFILVVGQRLMRPWF